MVTMNDDIAIEVKDVSKSFKLPLEKASSLKQAIFNAVSGKKGYEEHQVLRDISFKINKGDFIGVSTLMVFWCHLLNWALVLVLN